MVRASGICLEGPGFNPQSGHLFCLTLSRKQASLILQIKCTHFPLNIYLNRINKSETNNCLECTEIQEIPHRETINHFIFTCPAHAQAREELIAKIGEVNFQLPKIMANSDYMTASIIFIHRTCRFRKQNRPQPTQTQSQPHLHRTTPSPDI